jgi:hypothetical protein
MAGWADPPGEHDWHVCADCGMALLGSFGYLVCPATLQAPHRMTVGGSDELSFPYVQASYDQAFLEHEMGHAYGLIHGRSSNPISHDLGGDCWPGAYGDRFDVMSYGGSDSFTPQPSDLNFRFGRGGPSIAAHHLANELDVLPAGDVKVALQSSSPKEQVTLRPAARPDLPGYAALRIGTRLFVEYRRKGWRDPMGILHSQGWDRDLGIGDSPGAVLVYDVGAASPAVLRGATTEPYLVAHETYSDGSLGNVEISVISIPDSGDQAVVEVSLSRTASPRLRWLVLPCAYSDGLPPPLTTEQIGTLLRDGVEPFWEDMADGAFHIKNGFVVNPQSTKGDAWIPMDVSWAVDQLQSSADRIRSAVETTRRLKDPTRTQDHPDQPLFLDWRYFDGVMIVRNVPLGAPYVGSMGLPSGNTTPTLPANCSTATAIGNAAGPLPFRVIEIGSDSLSHAGIAGAIGRCLSLNPQVDRYDLMGTGSNTYRYNAPAIGANIGEPWWGPIGPCLSTEDLVTVGWLRDWRIFRAQVPGGQTSGWGSTTLVSLSHRPRLDGHVRAEIGPYSFELRTKEGWDSDLPDSAAVVRRDAGGSPTVMHAGDSTTWGGPPGLRDTGSVFVRSITANEAVLEYGMTNARVVSIGGGTLHGHGTILFTTDGRIIRIPPGDPWERTIAQVVDALAEVAERVAPEREIERR